MSYQQFQHYPSGVHTMNPDLAAIAQQGYAAQQAQLQARAAMNQSQGGQQSQMGHLQHMQQQIRGGPPGPSGYGGYMGGAPGPGGPGQMGHPPMPGMGGMGGMVGMPGMTPLQHAQQQAFGQIPMPGGQLQRPGPNAYKPERRSNAKAVRPPRPETTPQAPRGQDFTAPEPWTDAIDEIDHRELAMNRFRTRQEILSDIFGPERLKDIPVVTKDPWDEFGMSQEELEKRVKEMEDENAGLERKLESGLLEGSEAGSRGVAA